MSIVAVVKVLLKLDAKIKRVLAARAFKRSDAVRIKTAKATEAAHERRQRALNAALVAHEQEGRLIEAKDQAAYRSAQALDLQGSIHTAQASNHINVLEQLV